MTNAEAVRILGAVTNESGKPLTPLEAKALRHLALWNLKAQCLQLGTGFREIVALVRRHFDERQRRGQRWNQ
jgi:hypothetical protein